MSRQEVFEKMNEIFQDVFDNPEIALSESTSSDDIEGWDSLAQISLLVSIQNDFGVRILLKQTKSLKNVGDLVDLVFEKVQAGYCN